MMENLDTNVAKVVDALDELGLTKDTIIVFTSDNAGPACRVHRKKGQRAIILSAPARLELRGRDPDTHLHHLARQDSCHENSRTGDYDGPLPHAP